MKLKNKIKKSRFFFLVGHSVLVYCKFQGAICAAQIFNRHMSHGMFAVKLL